MVKKIKFKKNKKKITCIRTQHKITNEFPIVFFPSHWLQKTAT